MFYNCLTNLFFCSPLLKTYCKIEDSKVYKLYYLLRIPMEEGEDDTISELPEFSPKSEFSKARITEQYVMKVCDARGKDMREGYYNWKFDNSGNSVKTWNEDTRKTYCSTVVALMTLLTPEIVANARAMKAVEKFEKLKKELFDKYAYRERTRCILPNGMAGWKYDNLAYLPKTDEELPTEHPQHPTSIKYIRVAGLWNGKLNAYWDEMVQLHDNLFGELNLLIGTLNYFKAKTSF